MVSTIAAAAAAPAIPAAPRPSPARARGRASDDATSQPTPRKAADRALPATSLSTTRSWLVRRGVSEQQRCATEHGTARQARRRLWPVTARRDPSDADHRPKLVPLRQHSGAVRQQQAAERRAECVGLRAAGGARRWMRSVTCSTLHRDRPLLGPKLRSQSECARAACSCWSTFLACDRAYGRSASSRATRAPSSRLTTHGRATGCARATVGSQHRRAG